MSRNLAVTAGLVVATAVSGFVLGVPADARAACTRYWLGSTGPLWTDTGNWSTTDGGSPGAAAPGPADVACMSRAPGTADIALDTAVVVGGIQFAATATVRPTVTLSGAVLTLGAGPSQIDTLSLQDASVVAPSLKVGELDTFAGSAPPKITGDSGLTVVRTARIASLAVTAGSTVNLLGATTVDTAAGGIVADGLVHNRGTLTFVGDGSHGVTQFAPGTPSGILSDPVGAVVIAADSPVDPVVMQAPFTAARVSVSTFLGLDGGLVAGTVDSGRWTVGAHAELGIASPFAFASGTVSGPGQVDDPGQPIVLSGGAVIGNLLGSGNVVITGSGVLTNVNCDWCTAADGARLTVTGHSSIEGLKLAGGSVVRNTGSLAYTSFGELTVDEGSVFENAADLTINGNGSSATEIDGDGSPGSGVVNDAGATITANGSTSSTVQRFGAPLTNNGTVTVRSGELLLSTVRNLNTGSGILVGGTWIARGGQLALPRSVTTNDASITVDTAPGSALLDASTGLSGLRDLTVNDTVLRLSQATTLGAAFANKGQLVIAGGATVTVDGYRQTDGSTTVAAGSRLDTGADNAQLFAGTLSGSGEVDGTVYAAGATVIPGTSGHGTLTVQGSYKQSSGTLKIVPGNTKLVATGPASLGATLALAEAVPTPPPGTVVSAIVCAERDGTFANVTGPGAGSLHWQVGYPTYGVTLTLVSS